MTDRELDHKISSFGPEARDIATGAHRMNLHPAAETLSSRPDLASAAVQLALALILAGAVTALYAWAMRKRW
jgi:hypothetical protein